MRNLFLIIGFLLFSLSGTLRAETVLYCQSEIATGFINESGTWQTRNFKLYRFTAKFNSSYTEFESNSLQPVS